MSSPLELINNHGKALRQKGGKDGGNEENRTIEKTSLLNVSLPVFLTG